MGVAEPILEYEREQLGDDIYLPDCLSEIIKDAAEIAQGVDRELYIPDFSVCHAPEPAGVYGVRVNMTGMVMRGRFGTSPNGERFPGDFARNAGRLMAIESACAGKIAEAVALCDFDFEPSDEDVRARVNELVDGWSMRQMAFVMKWRADPPAPAEYASWPEFDLFCESMRALAADAAAVGF